MHKSVLASRPRTNANTSGNGNRKASKPSIPQTKTGSFGGAAARNGAPPPPPAKMGRPAGVAGTMGTSGGYLKKAVGGMPDDLNAASATYKARKRVKEARYVQ